MNIPQHIYRKAFLAYIRKGIPISSSHKQERTTSHYIWRTQGDGKVRNSHAEREGQVFSWDNPPLGGDILAKITIADVMLNLPSERCRKHQPRSETNT